MAKKSEINQDDFESLLNWLHADQTVAAQKYERIRRALIKIFLTRGCHQFAEEMTDETIDRVAKKSDQLRQTYQGKPELYFYGVANKIFLEFTRRPKSTELFNSQDASLLNIPVAEEFSIEASVSCLEECLHGFEPAQRQLILRYYQYENQEKLEMRRKLALELNFSINALRIRATRVRSILRKCVAVCLEKRQ